MTFRVRMVVVGLSFSWRSRCRRIQSIQLCAEAKVVCPDKVLAKSARENTGGISMNVRRAETANPLIPKKSLCH